jgi:hypothetical protein
MAGHGTARRGLVDAVTDDHAAGYLCIDDGINVVVVDAIHR